jgi:DinB superfamily
MGKRVDELVGLLLSSLAETLGVLAHLSDAELDDPSEHPCAMGGSLRDLLAHNIDHEQMHAGQIYSLRYGLRKMQKGQVDRLMAETLRARANLVATLIGLDDKDLDAKAPDDDWTIRQVVEHTLYWERHSIDDLGREKLGQRLPADRRRARIEVADPIEGKLKRDAVSHPSGNGVKP